MSHEITKEEPQAEEEEDVEETQPKEQKGNRIQKSVKQIIKHPEQRSGKVMVRDYGIF